MGRPPPFFPGVLDSSGTGAKLSVITTDTRMRNLFRYGNKAALIVGILLMLVDDLPLAHDFGAWTIGCLFCFWYSATAVHEDQRLSRKVKYGLFAYLVVVLLLLLLLHESGAEPSTRSDGSLNPVLKMMGIGKK